MWPPFLLEGRCISSVYSPQAQNLSAILYVLFSLRTALQALNSTHGNSKSICGRLWKSTLTEPVKLESYFENANEVSEGSSGAHACCRAGLQGRNPRIHGADLGARRTCRTIDRLQPTNDDADGMRRPLPDLCLRGLVSGSFLAQLGRDLLVPSA